MKIWCVRGLVAVGSENFMLKMGKSFAKVKESIVLGTP